ncbi:MAG: DUF4215 domain-containing protein [Nannocystaceae bacterium]
MRVTSSLFALILAPLGCFAPNLQGETAETDESSSSGADSSGLPADSTTSQADTETPATESTAAGDDDTTGDAATDTTDPDTTGGSTPSECGNGLVEPGEDCDDGETNGVAGSTDCLADCSLTTCGDGFLGRPESEECDQGEENADDAACTSSCTAAFCGDGLIGPGESCDDGEAGSDNCTSSCALASCGDGRVQAGEECDDSNDINTDACINCVEASCGDGFVESGEEECDEGPENASEPPVCSYGVTEDECTYCATVSCSLEVGVVSYCGDGVLQGGNGEECDDGAENGPNGACLADCSLNTCGDGFVGPDEACDDGEDENVLAGGACAPDCSTIIETREIEISNIIGNGNGDFGANPVVAADAACPPGYEALLTDPGARQATNSPYEADFLIDWPLRPYTRYVNSFGDPIWITDDVPLLGVRDGAPQEVENLLVNGGGPFGYFVVTGMEEDWTPLSSGSTCLNFSSSSSGLAMQLGMAAHPLDFIRAEGVVYDCDQPLMRVYCVEL